MVILLNKGKNSTTSNRRPPIEKGRWAAKGTKPLRDQASVTHILTVMLLHICKKVLFIATEVKITLYSISLFFGSLICDFLPIPRTYLSSRENIFNLYFVKVGWAWTFFLLAAFIYATSITYGCGHREIVKKNLMRLVIGTSTWCFWTKFFFEYLEKSTGTCLGKPIIKDSVLCGKSGFQWHAFDISGHAFLLVFINLILVEEAKAILGWENIQDLIRSEEHKRNEQETQDPTPLSCLTANDFFVLKDNYQYWTPVIRVIFFLMTVVSMFSDVMLACTVIYFHTMPQKVAGGAIAIGSWYLLYRVWFKYDASPGMPGTGLFKYQNVKPKEGLARKNSQVIKENPDMPTFMGMPIYKDKRSKKKDMEEEVVNDAEGNSSKYSPRERDTFFGESSSKNTKKSL